MTLLPILNNSLTIHHVSAVPVIPHRGASAVFNPTGTPNMKSKYRVVKDIFADYTPYSPVAFQNESATDQQFYTQIGHNRPYYHLVTKGFLEGTTPKLEFFDDGNPEQVKLISPHDLYINTFAGSLSGTLQVVLSTCYGMAYWLSDTYSESFAPVFVRHLDAYSVIGPELTIADYAAFWFTLALYDEIFNMGQPLNMAFSNAKQRTLDMFSDIFDIVSAAGGIMAGLAVASIIAILTQGGGLPAWFPIVDFVAGIWMSIVTIGFAWWQKPLYLNWLGLPFLTQRLRPPPHGGDPPPGGGGGCPILFVFDGNSYVSEGLLDIHASDDVIKWHWLSTTPESVNHRFMFRLIEHPQTISHIDNVRLFAILQDGRMLELPMLSAVHSANGNVRCQLLISDDIRTNTLGADHNNGNSEYIDLQFVAPPGHEIVEFFFVLEGYNAIIKIT